MRFAYRLLLGREPDPDGWRHYTAMVGRGEVSELVSSILCSEEFRNTVMHRAVLRQERDDLDVVDIGEGLRLLVSAVDASNADLHRTGRYETHLAKALTATLRPGMSYWAIGGNIGYHVVRAARLVGPRGRVVAFEAHPGNATLLMRNVVLNDLRNVVVLPVAIADRCAIYRYVEAQGTNGFIEPARGPADVEDVRDRSFTQVFSLDEMSRLVPPPYVIQVDVEGAEGLVLRGAENLLAGGRRPVIFSEFCIGQLERTSGLTGEAYLEKLVEYGYRLAVIGFDGVETSFERDAAALCEHARAQPTSHIDIRCDPRP